MQNETGSTIDARPILPVSLDSLWDCAAKRRDHIAFVIATEFEKQHISAWIRKSQPGEYPLYILVESWIRKEETSHSVSFDRGSLKLTITVEPWRTYNLIYKAELTKHGKNHIAQHWDISDDELRELALHVSHGGDKPTFFHRQFSLIELFFVANPLIPEARPNRYRAIITTLIAGS